MVDDRVLELRHRGWLLDGSFLLYDLETDSLWVQATGKAVLGPLKGRRLERLPVTHTTWGEWRRLQPDTAVLAKPLARVERYRRDRFEEYYRTHEIQFGLSVCLDGGQKLYPLAELEKTPLVQEHIGGVPALIVFHPPSVTAQAWDRRFEGAVLDFDLVETSPGDVILRDRRNGTRWSGMTGRGLDSGPSLGWKLPSLLSSQFAIPNWKRHYPEGTVYTAPGR